MDGYTGTTPVQVAELLGMPSITFAKQVTVVDGVVKVQRQTEAGYDEVEAPLPAVVTVTAGVVEPRYPSFKGIMSAKFEAGRPVDRRRSRPRRFAGRIRRSSTGNHRCTAGRGRGAEFRRGSWSDEGDGAEKIVAFLERLKVI